MDHICFLFGHRDASASVLPGISQAIEEVIKCGITEFYVGYHGRFDQMAAQALRSAKQHYPEIRVYLVLAWHPSEQDVPVPEGFDGSYYPPLEGVPRRIALVRANRYMVEHAESVICYAGYPGNSAELLSFARRQEAARGLIVKNTFVPRVDL